MLNKHYSQHIEQASEEKLREALKILLKPHATPVFGAAKAIEHEVAALSALKILEFIDASSDDFTLVEKLRITKSKAWSLLYQAALREESVECSRRKCRPVDKGLYKKCLSKWVE